MSQLVSVLVVVLIVLVAVRLVCVVLDQRVSRRSRRLAQQSRATDRSITREHLAARRAMNQAAGQAWRNQFE